MVDHLRSDAAQMAGLFVESVLYGIYLVTLGYVLICIFRSESGTMRWPSGIRIGTLVVALILATNSTLNLAWGLTRMMQTYIFKIATKGPTWIDLAKPYTVIIQTVTADFFLVRGNNTFLVVFSSDMIPQTYRCWAVYGKSFRVALMPICLSLAGLGVFIRIIIIQSGMNSKFGTDSHQVKAAEALLGLFTAQFVLTTVLNVYATSAIVYRIWKTDRNPDLVSSSGPRSAHPQRRTRFQRINHIIVQSALIYTCASIMAFGSYKSNAQYITSAVDIMAVGIAFNLIVIRLARERARGHPEVISEPKLTTLKFTSNPSDTRHSGHHSDSTNSLHLASPSTLLDTDSSHSQREKESV
ncbi:hypothetical protein CVT26_000749 [Gymnopilus dilepis]|uniref:Uncharacterized protein n=1 Tax=Gymnopilus dilepis TaxID=231916 RepID=A0A409Y2M0_9AGAR|nr:hypothetical protein CVT26_000749 [Gymnopilus dilepis]